LFLFYFVLLKMPINFNTINFNLYTPLKVFTFIKILNQSYIIYI